MAKPKQANVTDAKKTPVTRNVMDMIIKPANNSALLLAGLFIAIIESIAPDRPKNDKFKDHVQLATKFKDLETGKQHTEWYNTKGFFQYKDLDEDQIDSGLYENIDGWAVEIATGFRLESETKTLQAQSIFATLAYNCGFGEDESPRPSDLVGCTVGIRIAPDSRGNMHIKSTMKEEDVQVSENVNDIV